MGMTNKYGAAWEVPVTPKLPWDFRIVSDDGQEVRASEYSTAEALTNACSWHYIALPVGFAMQICHSMPLHRFCHVLSASVSSELQPHTC